MHCIKVIFGAVLFTAICQQAVESKLTEADTDVCGDMRPTDAMRNDPDKVIEWLRKDAGNQRTENLLNNHPFVRDVENGKIQKDDMRRLLVNLAYNLESMTRSLGGAINAFGRMYPGDERAVFGRILDIHRDALDAMGRLGAKFDIRDATDLLRHDPNPFAMVEPIVVSDNVQHVRHASVILGGMAPTARAHFQIVQRIRDALANRAEYKAWGLNADDLKMFDIILDMVRDQELNQRAREVIRQGIEEGVTLCEVRRNMNAINVGRLALWDATANMQPRDPIFQPGQPVEVHGF